MMTMIMMMIVMKKNTKKRQKKMCLNYFLVFGIARSSCYGNIVPTRSTCTYLPIKISIHSNSLNNNNNNEPGQRQKKTEGNEEIPIKKKVYELGVCTGGSYSNRQHIFSFT